MQTFKPSRFVRAKSKEEVLDILRTYGERARIVGGNTYLNELSRRGLLGDVEVLVDIDKLGLRYIERDAGGPSGRIRIGASSTIQDVSTNDMIASEGWLRALAVAAREVHPVQVRNTATMAGCISTGIPFLDVPCALLALGALVRVRRAGVGEAGEDETVEIGDYLQRFLELTNSGYAEEVILNRPKARASSAFVKFGLTGFDYATVNVAVSLVEAEGRDDEIAEASIVVGGKNIELARQSEAEAMMVGLHRSTDQARVIGEAAATAARTVNASDDIPIRGSADYKRRLVSVLVSRMLTEAMR